MKKALLFLRFTLLTIFNNLFKRSPYKVTFEGDRTNNLYSNPSHLAYVAEQKNPGLKILKPVGLAPVEKQKVISYLPCSLTIPVPKRVVKRFPQAFQESCYPVVTFPVGSGFLQSFIKYKAKGNDIQPYLDKAAILKSWVAAEAPLFWNRTPTMVLLVEGGKETKISYEEAIELLGNKHRPGLLSQQEGEYPLDEDSEKVLVVKYTP